MTMKILTKVEDTGKTAFELLFGEYITVFCMNYIYSGKLTGINDDAIMLGEAHIVYETGAFNAGKFKDAQALAGGEHFILKATIESFGKRGF